MAAAEGVAGDAISVVPRIVASATGKRHWKSAESAELATFNTLAKRAAELLARVGQPHKWTDRSYEAAKASPDQGQPQ